MGISINVDTSAFEAAMAAKRQELEKAVSRGIGKGGLIVEGEAKALSPVDTGALRASITSQTQDNVCHVGTNVEYAPYQEYGTYKMKAQPFLIPALWLKADDVLEAVWNEIKNI